MIDYSGTTGNSLGAHLHVEIHFKGGACLTDLNSAFDLYFLDKLKKYDNIDVVKYVDKKYDFI